MLYTRLPGYWMACMRTFVRDFGGEFTVVAKRENPDAPFDFRDEQGITIRGLDEFSGNQLLDFCKTEQPDILYITGWTEKQYLTVAKHFKDNNIPVICGGVDNKWINTLRQKIGAVYFKMLLKDRFSHIWIPGKPQHSFAEHLGFAPDEILTGLYSADMELFSQHDPATASRQFAKRFIFVGRYVEEKGLDELWQAFTAFHKSYPEWELWCFGDGPLMKEAPVHPNIQHHGFVQPEELRALTRQPGVFVLPSLKEPWGVVMHEFAAAGFPIICSDRVGAASAFLDEDKNGFMFEAGNANQLKACMEKMAQKTGEELQDMQSQSQALAEVITPQKWSETLRRTAQPLKYELS